MNIATAKSVIILGAGGHAKVVLDVLRQSGRNVIGITDPNKEGGISFFGNSVLGSDDVIEQYDTNEIELVNGLGALPKDSIRWKVACRMRSKGYKFATIIHPNAVIAEGVTLCEGVQIMAGCVLQPDTTIGLDSIINTGSLIDHDCEIGANCHIAPGVTLSGGVRVGDETHIGTGATVLQYISIGLNTVVAAGSIVYRDIKDGTTFIQSR